MINWVPFLAGLVFLLIAAVISQHETIKELRGENADLKTIIEDERVHNETKQAYTNFCCDVKLSDYDEKFKTQDMIIKNYRKEFERLKATSDS